jgi:hypothetical protein
MLKSQLEQQALPPKISDTSRREKCILLLIPPTPDSIPLQRVQMASAGAVNAPAVESITCQVELAIDTGKAWTIASRTIHGNPTCPGDQDEFYVVYHTHAQCVAGSNRPTAIAICAYDATSKNYALDFVKSPMNALAPINKANQKKQGHVSIHFQYTAHIGALSPPTKNYWRNGGYSQTVYIHRSVPPPPFCRPCARPLHVNLATFTAVYALGDSVLEQLVTSQPNRQIRCNKVAMPLTTRTLPQFVTLLLQHEIANKKNDTRSSFALILNSALWDLLSDEATNNTTMPQSNDEDPWTDHITALNDYIEAALQLASRNPSIQLFWLLPTAVHIHRVYVVDDHLEAVAAHKINRCRYMSSSRSRTLYEKQRQLMDSKCVPCIDLWEATYVSADWTLPGDGRHYRPEFNQLMLGWLYP